MGSITINRKQVNIACFFFHSIIAKAIFIALCAPNDHFVCYCILSIGFDEFYVFYCRKHHLVCFLPKINCLQTILCDHNVIKPHNCGFKFSYAILQYSGPSQIRPLLGPKGVQITEIFRFVKHISIIFLNRQKCFVACLQKVQYTVFYSKLNKSRSRM